MFNFNEQGKFESHEIAKEHSQNIEGNTPNNEPRKNRKDNILGLLALIVLMAGLISWLTQ